MAAGSLIVGVLLCEGLLHFIHPQVFRRPQVWHFDAELGWGHVPQSVGRLVSPEFDVEMRISGIGLRDREFSAEKASDSRRIALFGDSFVEGWGMSVESVVSRKLEACLRKQNSHTEVANFGVAGYGTDQALLFFERQGQQFKPDDVMLFFYGNDLWNNASRKGIGAERGYKPYFRMSKDGRLDLRGVPVRKTVFWDRVDDKALSYKMRLHRYLSQHWHLYKLILKSFQPEVPVGQQQAFYDGLYGPDEAGRYEKAWDLTGRLLQEFNKRVEESGAEFTVVHVPSIVQVEQENWQAKRRLHGLVGDFDLRKPNSRLADFARKYDLKLIDLLDDYRQRAASTTLYLRDSHWNAAGHALAAERLCAHLQGAKP